MPTAHQNISTSHQMTQNTTITDSTPRVVSGFFIATGTPFSHTFPHVSYADNWIGAMNGQIEITSVR